MNYENKLAILNLMEPGQVFTFPAVPEEFKVWEAMVSARESTNQRVFLTSWKAEEGLVRTECRANLNISNGIQHEKVRKLLTLPEAADYLTLSTSAVWRLMDNGTIPAKHFSLTGSRLGRSTVRFLKSDLDAYIDSAAIKRNY